MGAMEGITFADGLLFEHVALVIPFAIDVSAYRDVSRFFIAPFVVMFHVLQCLGLFTSGA